MNAEVIPSHFPGDMSGQEDGQAMAIGEIISRTNNLSASQVDQILHYQKEHGVRFGEAAVALGLAKEEDVLWALAQQFQYPYSAQVNRKISAEVVMANNPFSDQAEIFRSVRSQLMQTVFAPQSHGLALAVISANSGDGRSYAAANLATAFAQLGERVLLVDGDLRHPRQHQIFGIESSSGLSSILSGRAEARFFHTVEGIPSLHVMPVGVVPPNPLEQVQRAGFGVLIRELCSKFDRVIVDTPSASSGMDARVIAGHCGAALALCRRHHSKLDNMYALLAPLQISASVKLAGVLINDH